MSATGVVTREQGGVVTGGVVRGSTRVDRSSAGQLVAGLRCAFAGPPLVPVGRDPRGRARRLVAETGGRSGLARERIAEESSLAVVERRA